MSLRTKLALAMGLLTMLVTIAIGIAAYRSARDRMVAEIDRTLLEVGPGLLHGGGPSRLPTHGPLSIYEVQLIDANGTIVASTLDTPLPLSEMARGLVGEARASAIETVGSDSRDYRVRTTGLPDGGLQVARSLDETERVLSGLRRRTWVVAVVVAAVAAAVGAWLASQLTRSLRRLTAAAAHVEATGRLDAPVGSVGDDEVGQLGAAFDRMLAALARSRDQQQQLVQDAGHELRTPLTSLRTNVDALRRYPTMPDADRQAIFAALHAETEELTQLVDEVVTLASGEVNDEPRQPFDLAELVTELAERYQRRAGRTITVTASPTPVVAQRAGVSRAVSSLLDNARKFDTGGGPIEIWLARIPGGVEISVADRGIGIPEAERQAVFERFHRAPEARTLPGSGLGLAIVREVAERHGGTTFARVREAGGSVVGFTLPLG